MTEPPGQTPNPLPELDPEVLRILAEQRSVADPNATLALPRDDQPGFDEPGAGQPGAGGPASPPAPATSGRPGDLAGARGAAAAAAVTWIFVLVGAALADPSGLAAPIAWSGANPAVAPWAWLQYALYGPLMVGLLWLGASRLLRAATPAAPRRWVFSRTWLVVVLVVMTAKLVYSGALMAGALLHGGDHGLPWSTSLPYLVWSTGFAGIKTLLVGWVPALAAALLWRPGAARRSGLPREVTDPTWSLLPVAAVALGVAVLGRWLAGLWWTGSPVGYAYPTGWRLLAPTPASGAIGQLVALGIVAVLMTGSINSTLRRMPAPRSGSAHRTAGAIGAVAAGLGLAVIQSIVAWLFGTDVAGSGDLWILPSTYLRLIEGLSFGLLLAPFAAVAMWLMPRRPRPEWSWAVVVTGIAVLLGAGFLVHRTAGPYTGPEPLASDPQPAAMPAATGTLARLTVRRDADGTAVLADQSGAQVVLRGVNVNQLGDYYAVNPQVRPVATLTEQDFTDIAAMGFDAVRLVLSWSKVAPQSGVVDEKYLATVRQAVGWAGAHGIHVILDMHQDAWGKSVAAPEGTTCRAGTTPMRGWDGAPSSVTYVDGAPPCQFTGRDLAPNVLRAFTSFYEDRDAIEAQLVAAWGRLAQEFGGDPTVAGYDLLNEPSFAEQAPLTSGMLLGSYHARAIQAIRAGEASAKDGYAHPVFLEPSIWWSGFGVDPLPPRGFTTDSQVVFAPHLYNESITMDQSLGASLVGIERGWSLARRAAAGWGVPLWVGEWGSWRDSETNRAYYERFMDQADAAAAGTAMWVWKQACGDPHVYPSDEAGNIRRMACPSGMSLPTRSEELAPATRAYPRRVPGRLVSVEATNDGIRVTGTRGGAGAVDGSPDPCTLDVWVPGESQPTIDDARGLAGLHSERVERGSPEQGQDAGWRVLGCADGDYTLSIS